jgi:uncharacterized membrane protein YdjX (TVP38/TMEM64 family)
MYTKKLNANTKRWGKAILVLIGLTFILYWRTQIFEMIKMIGDREAIAAYLQNFGVVGPILLFIILALQVFLAIIPGHAFMVAGGYIYGLMMGTLITQFSTVIASQLAFLLTRKYGRPLVERMAPANVIEHWNKLAQSQGVVFFIFAFILPIFPNDLMCFIAGLSTISPKKFFMANFLGRLPCAIFVTLIGSHGFELPLYFWVLIVLGMVLLSIFWKKFSSKFEQTFLQYQSPTNCHC